MEIKFLVDECMGSKVSDWLENKGYDVAFVGDIMRAAKDYAVLDKALSENRIVITSDKDFGELVFSKHLTHCGIILIRLANGKPQNRIDVLEKLLNNHFNELNDNFITVYDTSIKIKKPPFH